MGVEPYLLSSALIGVMAQRLVRRICPECRTTYIAPPELVERFEWQGRGQVMLARGRGCRNCYDSGYKGRVAIHELIDIDRPLQSRIVADAGYESLREHVRRGPWPGLFDDGLERVLGGHTTLEEISRVVLQDQGG
jgi:type IV pilus assembly protein PilB